MIFGGVEDRTNAQVQALQAAERPLHLPRAFVTAAGLLGGEPGLRLCGPHHVDPVQFRLLADGLLAALPAEGALLDRPREVLGHLVAVDHPPYFHADLVRAEGFALSPGHLRSDGLQLMLRGRQQLLALAATLLSP